MTPIYKIAAINYDTQNENNFSTLINYDDYLTV